MDGGWRVHGWIDDGWTDGWTDGRQMADGWWKVDRQRTHGWINSELKGGQVDTKMDGGR